MADLDLVVSVLGVRHALRGRERWRWARLEAYRAKAASRLRRRAYANSPFYRRFHRGLETAPLDELPVLTKSMLMEHFDELVADRAVRLEGVKAFLAQSRPDERYLGRYWVTSTSGTSGHPGLFLLDRREWTLELATALRAFEWAGLRLGLTHRARVAQITSTNPSHLSSQGGRTMANWWMPTLIFDATEPLADIVQRLNAWRPEMMWAYASVIRALAEAQLAGRLQIAPRSVLSAAELLTAGVRQRATAAWGDVVFDTYATTDCGGLGAECEAHSGLHLMEDLAIVEVVDRDNRPMPAGAFGDKLLVTVLDRHTQPLIRYQLDDSIRLAAKACACGRPFRLIEAIQGRIEEVLSLPAVHGGHVDIHPNSFSNIMDVLPVTGWQVVQNLTGLHLLLAGAPASLDDAKVARDIGLELARRGAAGQPLDIRRVTAIPPAAAGKTPLVFRERDTRTG